MLKKTKNWRFLNIYNETQGENTIDLSDFGALGDFSDFSDFPYESPISSIPKKSFLLKIPTNS